MPEETTHAVTTATLAVTGMSCGHCVASVQKALTGVDGIIDAQVSVGSATVTIGSDDRDRVVRAAAAAIERAGYAVGATTDVGNPTLASSSCCCAPRPQSIARA